MLQCVRQGGPTSIAQLVSPEDMERGGSEQNPLASTVSSERKVSSTLYRASEPQPLARGQANVKLKKIIHIAFLLCVQEKRSRKFTLGELNCRPTFPLNVKVLKPSEVEKAQHKGSCN